ncbi:MAG TPA: dTDP-4-dehydrorhamnose reductase [Stellaceae bacterium]|nr:dTDP-4-dehydrorhamnose reductase [Stellaceae bacterium]
MNSTRTKVLIVGRTGQMAHELRRAAWPAGFTVDFLDRAQLDLAHPDAAREIVTAARPHIVVNAAAYTAVDAAESDCATAFVVNRDGPAALADGCREIGAALLHVSTDYVFDGGKLGPYGEDDAINPLSVYGASKAAGEVAVRARLDRHVIVRTAWVYAPVGRNFVKTMLRLGAERDTLTIVDDQHGSPTAAADLAGAAIGICAAIAEGRADIDRGGFGTFHFCGGGTTTWHGFAREIFNRAAERGLKTPRSVEPIATEAYPTPASRPRNSVLDCGKIGRVYGIAAPLWRTSLAACLDEIVAALPRPVAAGATR